MHLPEIRRFLLGATPTTNSTICKYYELHNTVQPKKERRRAQMRQKRLLLQSLCHKSTKIDEFLRCYVRYALPSLLLIKNLKYEANLRAKYS